MASAARSTRAAAAPTAGVMFPVAAASARVAASEAFQLAAEEMIQIHGGVGFTWEYDCHLFYRRAILLGSVLGDAAQWRDKLIDRLEARERAA